MKLTWAWTLGVSRAWESDTNTNNMITPHTHTFWQIFCGENIKPDVAGDLVFLLEIPGIAGIPVMRNVFDPAGIEYPTNSYVRLQALLELGHHGVLFEGVSKAAVRVLMDWEPPIVAEDFEFVVYNRRLVWSSMNLLLCDPLDGLEQLPSPIIEMLRLTAPPTGMAKG